MKGTIGVILNLVFITLMTVSCGGGTTQSSTETGDTTPVSDTPADSPANPPADEPADPPADPPADTPADPPADPPADGSDASLQIEGYGSKTAGGANGEICTVTTLIDEVAGSLRDCISNRNKNGTAYIPRTIQFSVGGVIQLTRDLFINTPYLTIDGSTAPLPGITIRKISITDGEMIITSSAVASGHDVIIKYIRFDGEWDLISEIIPGANNSATLAIDGENHVGTVYNIVLDHLTIHRATDSGPDFWGDIHDVTVQWCLIYDNIHPTTISHSGGTMARKNFSFHHNIYAYNHERNPKIRGNTHDMDFRNNIIFQWKRFPGGYGVQLQDRNGVYPTDINFINNYFYSDQATNVAFDYATTPYPGNIHLSGNRLPADNTDSAGTTAQAVAIPENSTVTTYAVDALASQMLPYVGTHYRTAREQDIVDEIKNVMLNDPQL